MLFLIFSCFLYFIPSIESTTQQNDFAVAAYLPEWRYEGANWDVISKHVSHLILFSLELTAKGKITSWDRLPRPALLRQARKATRLHGTKLLMCFGGNGRSNGFSPTVQNKRARKRFVKEVIKLCDKYDFDGVDYNWEYPGYSFRGGYKDQMQIHADYQGLKALVSETRVAFRGSDRVITLAYYPDGRQEKLFSQFDIPVDVDLMHMMTYDQHGAQHSSLKFAKQSIATGIKKIPANKLTVGLPFYGRHSKTGDWVTYEDIIQQHAPLSPKIDSVAVSHGTLGFNGIDTIHDKTQHAITMGIAGVMIWEVGQDCRLLPVKHGDKTHPRTCPHDDSSLLVAISRAMLNGGVNRMGIVRHEENIHTEL